MKKHMSYNVFGRRRLSAVRRLDAFTLVELLVVIAIIGVLIALLLPAVQAAREAARRSQCTNNLKQIALSIHNYHDTHNIFPPGAMRYSLSKDVLNCDKCYRGGWTLFLFPFMEQGALYETIEWDRSDGAGSRQYETGDSDTVVNVMMCPSDRSNPFVSNFGHQGNYMAVRGTQKYTNANLGQDLNGLFWNLSDTKFRDIIDGTSNTAMLAELILHNVGTSDYDLRGSYWFCIRGNCTVSTEFPPNTTVPDNATSCVSLPQAPCTERKGNNNYTQYSRSYHPGGAQAALADGSVRFVSENIDLATWRAVGTKASGEVIGGW